MKKLLIFTLLLIAGTANAQPFQWSASFPPYSVLLGNSNQPIGYLAPSDSLKMLQCMGANTSPIWVSVDSIGVIVTPVSIANGGTNSSTALSGSSIMVSDGTHVVQGTKGATTTVLHGNASGSPTYGAVSLTADITGTLAATHGGTGVTSTGALFILLVPDTTGNTGKKLTVKAGGGFDWE